MINVALLPVISEKLTPDLKLNLFACQPKQNWLNHTWFTVETVCLNGQLLTVHKKVEYNDTTKSV